MSRWAMCIARLPVNVIPEGFRESHRNFEVAVNNRVDCPGQSRWKRRGKDMAVSFQPAEKCSDGHLFEILNTAVFCRHQPPVIGF